MSFDADRLYELLPAVHRIRDAEQGEPLRALLSVIAEQVGVLEADLDQLYDDQFIETCAEWVTAYIGDLIGYRPLHGKVPSISSPRAEVAHTIAFRRRKGTAAVLEQLARDVSSWKARVVEFFQLLGTTQFMNHIRLDHSYAPNLRDWELLERLDTPFDKVAHTVDVRHIATRRGRYNIPNVGIFLWRLGAFSLTKSPASNTADAQQYMFSPLGNNTPLFTRPETEDEITHLAEPINVPEPISRRVLHERLDDYYGPGKSILLTVDGAEKTSSEITVCDLSDLESGVWAHTPLATEPMIAIDPVLGRIAFSDDQTVTSVEVTFHYGFSAELGGGEYERTASLDSLLQPVELITSPGPIQAARNNLTEGGVAQITDSGRYEEALEIDLNAGEKLELRAANEHRPTLVLGGDMQISGDDAEVTLNGLLIIGGKIVVPESAKLRRLTLRHCTLVPGLSLDIKGQPQKVPEPSLVVEPSGVSIEIDRCIVGPLRIAERSDVQIIDSIVDATAQDKIAFAGPPASADGVGGTLKIQSSTIIGRIHAAQMTLVSNSILLAAPQAGDTTSPVRSERKQAGCVRFSYLPENASVPRRYRTQPDLAIKTALEEAQKRNSELTDAQKEQIARETGIRVRPVFSELRYGQPDYAQLDSATAIEIRTGADDESEMGAFHHLFAPQRETNINVRLDEYLRFGLEAGIFFET